MTVKPYETAFHIPVHEDDNTIIVLARIHSYAPKAALR